MKKYIFALVLTFFSSHTQASISYVVVMAKDYPASVDRSKLFEQFSGIVFSTLKQGDSLLVMSDGQNTLAEFKVPDQDGYDALPVKRRIFYKPMQSLKTIIQSLPQGAEAGSALLHIPQTLKFLSTQKFDNTGGDRKVSVLLVGSALYIDDKEQSFNMKDGIFPSDGHIRASERHTVYGTDDKRGFLNGFTIHMLITNAESDWANDLYKFRIKRFWSLFSKNQGGVLATFTNDRDTAFDRFAQSANTQIEPVEFDYTANKVEMLRITRDVLPVNDTKEARIADFMSDGVILSNIPPSKTTGKLKIGIRWPCLDCDVDLYAKSAAGADYLYYGKSSTDEGTYFKDFQNSPDTIHGLEYIEFTKEVDASNINAKINLYKGNTDKPVSGVVRAEFDGKVYEKPFIINATQGNSGGNDPNYWTSVDVKELLGMK